MNGPIVPHVNTVYFDFAGSSGSSLNSQIVFRNVSTMFPVVGSVTISMDPSNLSSQDSGNLNPQALCILAVEPDGADPSIDFTRSAGGGLSVYEPQQWVMSIKSLSETTPTTLTGRFAAYPGDDVKLYIYYNGQARASFTGIVKVSYKVLG